MTETEAFLESTMARYRDAETAIHNGDAAPRKAMWAHTDPVTLLGAVFSATGWDDIQPIFDRLQARFSNCTSSEHELIAAGASGDLAYIVALEHTTVSVGGSAPLPYALRATTVFRREDGEWKVVHRHADPVTSENGAELVQRLAAADG
ncbi:MAG TPA: nuclear transport factor 2 family protein [Acidimicrobiales bacterium]|nr:nuclear transport factor 2 family protein [Acidimicrobiales bacterium]